MTRIIEVEIETRAKKVETAISRFFTKHPELSYWREHIEWMADNHIDFTSDERMADGSKNKDWAWAIHFNTMDDWHYICIIERA